MNKTVAIVGTHPTTREKAPYQNKDIDIWIFNNQLLQGWCPRAEAVFDIHASEDVYRRGIEHPGFGEWLKSAKKGTIFYTPYEMKEIPGNKVYPKDNIVKHLLPKFLRGEEVNEYFTSGPCYAIALAIHQGYKRIEMYGIEMESNSEYIYQRDGVGLWLGIALGRGIEIYFPPETQLFNAPLYGYQSDATTIDLEAFETRASELAQALEKTLQNYTICKDRLDTINVRINAAKAEGQPDEEIAKFGDEYRAATLAYEQSIADHAFINGQYLNTRMWQTRVQKALEYQGHSQEILAQNDEKWSRFQNRIGDPVKDIKIQEAHA